MPVLYPHQEEALKLTKGKNKVAYYLDMGLGKTFCASEKMLELDAKLNLIVCPKSLVSTWKQHFQVHYFYSNISDLTKEKDFISENNKVAIINYDLIWRRPELLKLRNYTLILDESSYIKNESSKRAKFIMKMKPDNIILLSGTPTGGKYEELYSQAKLLGWQITKKDYWKYFINTIDMDVGGFKVKKVIGYKNTDRLKRKFREHGAVFMKTEDVFSLPEQIDIKVACKMPTLYKKFQKNRLVEVDDKELVGDMPLTRMLYSRQLASQYNADKIGKLKELIEGTNDRLIIFYNFKEELEIIKALTNRPLSIINGKIKDLQAYENEEDSITLIQYQAGSMGLNLQKANKIIYFSLTLSAEQWLQSKKRTNRIGQSRTCFYYYLLTEGSIDEAILDTLEKRKDYTLELFEEGGISEGEGFRKQASKAIPKVA